MDIYSFANYKEYLNFKLGPSGIGRGAKSELAKYLNCQNGFVSQVLKGEAQFSLEHSIKVAQFLRLSDEEEEFFMLLIQYEKSGSSLLRDHFKKLMHKKLEDRKEIKKRLKIKDGLSSEQQAKYYSSWVYAATHIALLVPNLRTVATISKRLHLDSVRVMEILDDLVSWGLAIRKGEEFIPGKSRLHLEKSSPHLNKHQQNWRIEAMKSIEKSDKEQLHYSGVLAFSYNDSEKVREVFLKAISEMEKMIEPSPEEELFAINLDFFTL